MKSSRVCVKIGRMNAERKNSRSRSHARKDVRMCFRFRGMGKTDAEL